MNRDAAIHAAMLIQIVPKDRYVAAVKQGLEDLERFKQRVAVRDLTDPVLHRMLRHFGLDRVPIGVLPRPRTCAPPIAADR